MLLSQRFIFFPGGDFFSACMGEKSLRSRIEHTHTHTQDLPKHQCLDSVAPFSFSSLPFPLFLFSLSSLPFSPSPPLFHSSLLFLSLLFFLSSTTSSCLHVNWICCTPLPSLSTIVCLHIISCPGLYVRLICYRTHALLGASHL